jgi:hypothetical protein
MKKVSCTVALLLAVAMATPAWSADEVPPGLMTPPKAMKVEPGPAPGAGASLLAGLSNVVYFPLRFTITVATAEVGGFAGWLTGGDRAAAHAVCQSTDGPAYIRPEVIEGRERLRFGHWQ